MKQKVKIECEGAGLLPLSALLPFQGNLKTLAEEDYQKFKAELLDLGFSSPFHIWKDGDKRHILDGHQRLKTLSRMKGEGHELPAEFPVVWVHATSLAKAKKKVLALTSQYGKIEKKGLLEFMTDAQLSFDDVASSFRFPEIDMTAFREEFEPKPPEPPGAGGEDDVPEPPKVAKTKPGDLYVLGGHRLLCGDSAKAEDMARLMGGEKAALVFTDPPYNIASHSKNFAADKSKAMNDLKNSDWDKNFDIIPALETMRGACLESVTVYVWTSHWLVQTIWDQLNTWCDFTSYCIWAKPNPMPSLSKRHWTWNSEICVYGTRGTKRTVNFPESGHAPSVWQFNKKSDGTHPTQKPIELCEHGILFSSAPKDLVLDLFLGSGSTLIACEKTKRRCFGMEIDPIYCDVIVERWEKYSGKKATLSK